MKIKTINKKITTYMLIAVLIVTSLIAGLGVMLSNKTSSASAAEASDYWKITTFRPGEIMISHYDHETVTVGAVDASYNITIPKVASSIDAISTFYFADVYLACKRPDGSYATKHLSTLISGFNSDIVKNSKVINLKDIFTFDLSGEYTFFTLTGYTYFSESLGIEKYVDLYSNILTCNFSVTVPLPPDPTKAGHTFKGWYLDEALTQAYDGRPIYADTVLYAGFTINTYTLTFNTDGGSNIETATYNWNTNITELPTPSRTGYNFKGWTHDGASFTSGIITSDMTLAATWEAIIYKVTFKVDGETYKTLDVPYGTTLSELKAQASFMFHDFYIEGSETKLSDKDIVTQDTVYKVAETSMSKFVKITMDNLVWIILGGVVLVAMIVLGIVASKKAKR